MLPRYKCVHRQIALQTTHAEIATLGGNKVVDLDWLTIERY